MLYSRECVPFVIVTSRKLSFLLFSSSRVKVRGSATLLNSFKTSCMFVLVESYTIKISSTYRKNPNMLNFMRISYIVVCSVYCRNSSERMDEEGAPIARPVFCLYILSLY